MMIPTLRVILPDQLSASITALQDLTINDTILLAELKDDMTLVEHHPKKIAFIVGAMRHFAAELRNEGYKIRYIQLNDPANTGSLTSEVARAINDLAIKQIIVTDPSEYHLKQMILSWPKVFNLPVKLLEDNRFLCSIQEFKLWAKDKKQLRMEYFYRKMRQKYQILMDQNNPLGGKWNYDKENRKPPSKGLISPKRISHRKSRILKEVLTLVAAKFSNNFGDLEPFHYALTRQQALIELDDFVKRILPYFGDYQDAMVKGEAYLNHSLLSSYINVGLLLPLEICRKVEIAYRHGKVRLNAAEGFIRQVLGWREYIRGIYWLKMPEYAELNYLEAKLKLPDFYWGKPTRMACIAEVVAHTRQHAYSHHIQRLMITGNFALLAGIEVKQVQAWYLAVYSDAYPWVEMPNTLGMALFGDGGIVGSKPYAASGNYIAKMSNFCEDCKYDPKKLVEKQACPFNALYWDFHRRNRTKLKQNQRLTYVYSTWDRFDVTKQAAITAKADQILLSLKQENL